MEATNNKKVTFIFGLIYPFSNGVGNCTLSYAAALSRMGYETSIITCRLSSNDPVVENYMGVTIYRILKYRVLRSRILGVLHLSTLGSLKILIHLILHRPDFLVGMMLDYGVISAFMGSILRIPSITNAQGSDVDEVATFFRRIETLYALRKNDILTTTNNEFKKKLLARVDRRIELWPNILDGSMMPNSEPVVLKCGIFHMITVGRLVRMHGIETKGISYIIDSMSYLPECHLHIFGDGPLKIEYEKRIKELSVENRITLHGHQSRETILSYMKSADVIILASLTEGLSMTVIEAMDAGKPVVTTKIGGQADHIQDGENGFFIQKENSQSIVDVITRIRNDESLLAKVSINAKQYFEKNFSFLSFAEVFKRTIQNIRN